MTTASTTTQPCPNTKPTHSEPCNDNPTWKLILTLIYYHVCTPKTDTACIWLEPCWPMAWSTVTDTMPTWPCYHNATTYFENSYYTIPPVNPRPHIDDDTYQPTAILLQLKQLTAQCELLQLLFNWLLPSPNNSELHHPMKPPASFPPSNALTAPKHYITLTDAIGQLIHPNALNYAPIHSTPHQNVLFEYDPTICTPPCPPLPPLDCAKPEHVHHYQTHTLILPPPLMTMAKSNGITPSAPRNPLYSTSPLAPCDNHAQHPTPGTCPIQS